MSIKIDGMVRVAAATPHVKVADCPYNKNEMAKMIREAAANGASVIAFPELAMTGYTCGDLFKDRKLMESAKACLFDLIEETEDLDILCAVGMPIPSGGALYNCAAVFSRGVLLGLPAKQHIPNYSEFYELRHFSPAPESGMLRYAGDWYVAAVPLPPDAQFCAGRGDLRGCLGGRSAERDACKGRRDRFIKSFVQR